MLLEVGYNSRVLPASEQGIPFAVRNLPGMDKENSFIVLSDGEERYIQVTGGDGEFRLEYYEDFGKKHYWADYELSEEDVVNTFMSFWKKDGEYRKNIIWQRDTSAMEKIQLAVLAVIIGSLAFYTGMLIFKEFLFDAFPVTM